MGGEGVSVLEDRIKGVAFREVRLECLDISIGNGFEMLLQGCIKIWLHGGFSGAGGQREDGKRHQGGCPYVFGVMAGCHPVVRLALISPIDLDVSQAALATLTIHGVPKRSVTMPKPGDQKVLVKGMPTWPPSARPSNTR